MRTFAWGQFATAGLVALLILGCSKSGEPKKDPKEPLTGEPTRVVAKVNSDPITLAEVNRIVQAWRSGRFRDIDPNTPEPQLQQKAIDNLLEQRLLVSAAKDAGQAASDADVDAQLQSIKARFPDEAAFQQALQQQGLSETDVKSGFRTDMTIQGFIQKSFLDTIAVTPEQARRYFDQNPGEFAKPEMVHARHILVRTGAQGAEESVARAKAEGLLKEVRGGADFAAVAQKGSEDNSAAQGGDLGTFKRGDMVGPFDSTAFALAPGEISGLVRTPFGFHIIKVEERIAPGTFGFDEVATQLFSKLRSTRSDAHVKAFLAERKKKAKIQREI